MEDQTSDSKENEKVLARSIGYAPIKTEFLLLEQLCDEVKNVKIQASQEISASKSEAKKQRPVDKKFRGTDRQREKKMANARAEMRRNIVRLCPSVFIPDKACRYGDKCTAEHSMENYMKIKPPDLGSKCYLFDQMGACPFSLSCRFANAHTKMEDISQLKKEPASNFKKTLNSHSVFLQIALRKHEYDFKLSEQAISNLAENTGAMIREPLKLDMRSLSGEPYLAPLTTVGNLPFRRLCVSMGAKITCSEMSMATNLLNGQPSEWALMKRHPSEKIFGVQLAGGFPDTMSKAAQIVRENMDVDFIDINLGCPLDVVNDKGGGCMLFSKSNRLVQVVKCMSHVIGETPLTVKLRYGIKEGQHTAHHVVKRLADECPPQLITIHPRSKEQRYTKSAEWDYVPKCVEAIHGRVPLWACGDRLDTPVSGVMIGRGALIKPWIFTEILERRHWDITASERLDIVKNFVNFGLEHWGSDNDGVESTRRFLLEWLSFSHRYIPIGILEVLPPKINQKPPLYRGRNELETLMSSPAASDWVKISEMFLGTAPEGFLFVPKHNANAY